MKIQVFSDLHVDVDLIKPITIVNGVEAVIVAGDVCQGATQAFEQLRRIVPMWIPIVMVLGNHEYYRRFIPDELALARAHAAEFNIYVLEPPATSLMLGDVRFIGATLWTDYRIFGETNQAAAMNACASGMNDHRLIGWQKQPWLRFRPQEAALMHHQSKTNIESALATPFEGSTVVVTHHAPHWNSVHSRFRNDPVTAAFVSDQSAIIETYQPTLWVHGHVHHSCDYHVGRTRILCNAHGYGEENPAFNGALVLEVGA